MGYDWNKAAENSGPPSMGEGWYWVRVVKVIFEKKDGTRLSSEKGGDFFMLVCENQDGEQGTLSLWPTVAAGWKIAQTLSCLGVSMDELENAGITPEDFNSYQTAEDWFVGREGWVSATVKGKYTNIDFHHEDKVPVSVLQSAGGKSSPKPEEPRASRKPQVQHEPLDDEDIPF
jgi:hypothetical protein